MFKKELDKDVAGDTSGNFAKLLLALVQVSFISFTYSIFFIFAANTDMSGVSFSCRPNEQNHLLSWTMTKSTKMPE